MLGCWFGEDCGCTGAGTGLAVTRCQSHFINLSYRIAIELLIQDETITPIDVGDHDEVCGGGGF